MGERSTNKSKRLSKTAILRIDFFVWTFLVVFKFSIWDPQPKFPEISHSTRFQLSSIIATKKRGHVAKPGLSKSQRQERDQKKELKPPGGGFLISNKKAPGAVSADPSKHRPCRPIASSTEHHDPPQASRDAAPHVQLSHYYSKPYTVYSVRSLWTETKQLDSAFFARLKLSAPALFSSCHEHQALKRSLGNWSAEDVFEKPTTACKLLAGKAIQLAGSHAKCLTNSMKEESMTETSQRLLESSRDLHDFHLILREPYWHKTS